MSDKEIVLEYLKSKILLSAPILTLEIFAHRHFGAELPENVGESYQKLTLIEECEIIVEYGEFAFDKIEKGEE